MFININASIPYTMLIRDALFFVIGFFRIAYRNIIIGKLYMVIVNNRLINKLIKNSIVLVRSFSPNSNFLRR